MHSIRSFQPLRQIICAAAARYAAITPKGILIPAAPTPYNPFPVSIVTYKPARTLYVKKQPHCRSLNGLHSLLHKRPCTTCDDRRACTPQIALEILYRNVPFRLMLAYTSAKNFLAFTRTLNGTPHTTEGAPVVISVIDRGRWGEARFQLAHDKP